MRLDTLARSWWVMVVRGLFGIAFAVVVLATPAAAIEALVLVFGIYALADGLLALSALLRPHEESGWRLALLGVVSTIAGLVALFWPGITALALFLLIAWWAIAAGIVEIATGVAFRRVMDNEWMLVLRGVVSLLFGIVLLARPSLGVIAVLAMLATYSFVIGIVFIALGLRMRGLGGAGPTIRV